MIFTSIHLYSQVRVTELYEISPGRNITVGETSLKTWIDTFMGQLFYVEHNFSQSSSNDNEFHSMKFATKDTLLLTVPQTPIKIVIGTQAGKRFRTSQIMLLDSKNGIAGQIGQSFDPADFDFSAAAYFNLACKAKKYTDGLVLASTFNNFIDIQYDNKTTKFHLIIDRINKIKKTHIPYPDKTQQTISWLKIELAKTFKDIPTLIYELYISDKSEGKTWQNIHGFFNDSGIKDYINDLINPTAKVYFENGENVLFPSGWFVNPDRGSVDWLSAPFKQISFTHNRFLKRYEITIDILINNEMELQHGTIEGYSSTQRKSYRTVLTKDNTQKIKPTKMILYVELNRIEGLLKTDDYETIILFDNKRS